ncbi:rRNA maturation RNase YbeY [Mycoplasma sp. ATU-Cv-703]|uniref:rRNA maturation RNase YbeY n=1 Tax=Mycoplasma sp. ATU-Cv-703 TaxID=2498595 RepID=UPI000FDD4502
MISLTIVNQSGWPFLRRSLLQKIAQQVGQKVLKNAQVEVSAIIIGDKQSQALNQTYRQKNQVSDVLAFPSEIEKSGLNLPQLVLGDIYLNRRQIARQARTYGHSLRREWGYIFTHGLLHLCGYDHKSPAKEKQMHNLTEKIIGTIGLTRS